VEVVAGRRGDLEDSYRNSDTVDYVGGRRQMSVKSLINYGGGGEI
jgi:hypothetical protein